MKCEEVVMRSGGKITFLKIEEADPRETVNDKMSVIFFLFFFKLVFLFNLRLFENKIKL